MRRCTIHTHVIVPDPLAGPGAMTWVWEVCGPWCPEHDLDPTVRRLALEDAAPDPRRRRRPR